MFTLAPLLIAIFLETFKSFCKNSKDGNNKKFLIQGRLCFQQYKMMATAFGRYFLLFFVSNQLINIFFVYFNLQYCFSLKEITLKDALSLSSSLLNIFSFLANLMYLTEAVDDAFEETQFLRSEIHERLHEATDENEVKDLEYLKNQSEMIRPMSAAGYFEINKNTLTSMLSVRY